MSNGPTLFDLFGGIRPMASEVGERPSTVQDWKNHGRIPATKQPAVLRAAIRLHLPVEPLFIIFPLGIPDDLVEQQDLFDRRPIGLVIAAPIVACDPRPISQRQAAL